VSDVRRTRPFLSGRAQLARADALRQLPCPRYAAGRGSSSSRNASSGVSRSPLRR